LQRGIAGFQVASNRAGMRGDGLPALDRAPALQNDHGLAQRTGTPACRNELPRLSKLLEEDDDGFYARLFGQERQIVGDGRNRFVAGSDEVAEPQSACSVEQGDADRAALHDSGCLADWQLAGQRGAEQSGASGEIQEPQAIRTAHGHVVRTCERRKLPLQLCAPLACLAEAAR
jgi:hypothetical protein